MTRAEAIPQVLLRSVARLRRVGHAAGAVQLWSTCRGSSTSSLVKVACFEFTHRPGRWAGTQVGEVAVAREAAANERWRRPRRRELSVGEEIRRSCPMSSCFGRLSGKGEREQQQVKAGRPTYKDSSASVGSRGEYLGVRTDREESTEFNTCVQTSSSTLHRSVLWYSSLQVLLVALQEQPVLSTVAASFGRPFSGLCVVGIRGHILFIL